LRSFLRRSSRLPRLRGLRQLAWIALVCLFIQAVAISSAFATDYTVTKTTDSSDGVCDADCSLREAIVAANTGAGADRVLLGSGLTYTLSLGPFDAAGTAAPGSGDLDIIGALTIEGNGSAVDASGIDRVFDIQGAFAVTINDLTIRGGVARGFLSLGGGLNIRGAAVVLNSCVVTGNSTAAELGERDAGGGVAVAGSFDAATGTATLASLALNNTTVSNNTGSNGGGIVCVLCTLTASRANITGNTANAAHGGGIQLTGSSSTSSLVSSSITLNAVAGGSGGGMAVPAGTSTSTLTRSRIASNTSLGSGSGLFSALAAVNAANNWWGCNSGPGAVIAGCAGMTNSVAGGVTATPFLVLKASASPAAVMPHGSSTMTADLTFNSTNADTSAGGAIPDWTIVTFSETFGSFAPPSSATTSGKATGIYTAGSASGWARLSASVDNQTVSAPVLVGTPSAVAGDFDADHGADLALFRPGSGNWMFRFSSSNFASGPDLQFGVSTDKPVPGDYDGDRRIDMAVYRPSNGTWYVIFSSTGALAQLQWGLSTDVPMPADYTGDGRTDLAVWRPSTGVWYILDLSSGTFTSHQWGISTDIPLAGDYDGDGKADVTAYRPSTGVWWVFFLPSQTFAGIQWGISTDVPLPADYTGDGRTDLAVYRPSTGYWYVYDLGTATYVPYQWGVSTDIPAPKDYDGDGRTDLAIWRPSTGKWFIYFLGTNTFQTVTHGASGDVPIR
jgi:CSLREA domain-containing protein